MIKLVDIASVLSDVTDVYELSLMKSSQYLLQSGLRLYLSIDLS